DFTGLAAGFYALEVYDENGCLKDTTFTITQPDSIEILHESHTSLTSPGASDGEINVYAEGGTSPLKYILYDTIPEPDSIVTTIETSDTANFTGLPESDYYVIVTDDNECDSTQSSIFHIAPMEIQFTVDPVICPGDSSGQIVAEVIGGSLPLTYEWTALASPGDSLRRIEDTTSRTDTLRDVPAGEYELEVKDGTGFSLSDTVEVGEPDPMIISILPDSSVSCYGSVDSFEVDITNGVPPYNINWYNSSGVQVSDTATAEISAGKYYIEATDSNGCYTNDSVTITQPDEIAIDSISPLHPDPYGLDVWASGGNDSLYIYLERQNADTTLYPDSASYNTSTGATFAGFESLSGDTYEVIATDSICQADTLTITIPISVELEILDSITCGGEADGVLEAEVTGGNKNKPYTYEWSNGVTNTSDSETDTLSGLNAGEYYVTVEDNYGMTASDTITLTDPPAINITDTTIIPSYCKEGQTVLDDDTGAIYIDVEGGRPYSGSDYKYKYDWEEGIDTNEPIGGLDSLTEVGSGTYTLTVYDRYGCKETEEYYIPHGSTYELDAEAGIIVDGDTHTNKEFSVCPSDSVNLQAISLSNVDSAYWQPMQNQEGFRLEEDFEDTLRTEAIDGINYVLIARNEKCKAAPKAGVTYFHDSPDLRFATFNGRDVRDQDSVNILEKHESANITAEAIDSLTTSYTWGENTDYFESTDQLNAVLNINAVQEAGYNETVVSIETETKDTSEITNSPCRFGDYLEVNIIPNVNPVDAFSPNGDGNNDEWLIKYGTEYDELEVIIFNRWGGEVFRKKGNFDTSQDYGNHIKVWDGKTKGGRDLPSGTYYYIIDPHVTGVQTLKGTVTIIR
ncbi:MAG: gliding motility-associated C-terminal domain-containing protein, partial [Bacteroidota bacterium]